MPHALIVDDDADARDFMSEVAEREGFTVASAESLRTARAQLVRQPPDVLLTDLKLPDGNGIDLVGDLDRSTDTEVVVVTGHASVDSAVEALRVGATDYLIKPIDVDRLINILRRQPRTADLKLEIGELREELRRAGRFGHLWGASPPMQQLYDKIARVAPTSATVLLIGESGTGKELAARTIHDLSKRKRAPFLAINCGAISPQLIESELFGHEKGSFTGADRQHKGFFERANGGTILLDEITEMSLALQVKLLRVLETGTFVRVGTTQPIATDVRIIAATNKQPGKAVQEGKFREDLYHRLNVFPIQLPPLRERGDRPRDACRALPRRTERDRGHRQALLARRDLAAVRPPVAGQRARAEELRAARLHHGGQRDRRQRASRCIAAGGRGRRPADGARSARRSRRSSGASRWPRWLAATTSRNARRRSSASA